MIAVKICGITSLKDAEMAVNYSVSAIGMIFCPDSPRYVDPTEVEQWIERIPDSVKKVGVFVNEQIDTINNITRQLKLEFIQLHGDESPEFCNGIIRPVIKVFRVGDDFDAIVLNEYDVHGFLFDTYKKGNPGGTGTRFNWDLIANLKTETPIILSGGLTPENVLNGIEAVNPAAVDVNSGVESVPGVKDEEKIKELFSVLEHSNSCNNPFRVIRGEIHDL
jgi:phosphoribosylanthranilate isomerase